MDIATEIKESLGKEWIPSIYAEKVRGQRTRSHLLDIVEKEHAPEILYTLLGIELKVGNKRFACPDLAGARYLQVFARLGVREFAVPYDITQISGIADQIETAWQRLLLLIERETKGLSPTARSRIKGRLIRDIRKEIAGIGPGEMMPEFKKSTKQRQ